MAEKKKKPLGERIDARRMGAGAPPMTREGIEKLNELEKRIQEARDART